MRQVVTSLIAIACLTLCVAGSAQAQTPGVTVGFRNNTNVNVIVQGYTVVNNVQRRGQTLKVERQGGMAFESTVPSGYRYYTIYDAKQPQRIFLLNYPVPVKSADLFFTIEVSPVNPGLLVLRPAQAQQN